MTRLMQQVSEMAARNIRRRPSLQNEVTQDPACATCYFSMARWSEQAGHWLVCTAEPKQNPDCCDAYIREPGSDDV